MNLRFIPVVRIQNVRDFSGGLNLLRDQFQLAPNELSQAMDVNLVERGGVKLRQGVLPWGGAGSATMTLGNTTLVINNIFTAEGLGAAPGSGTLYAFVSAKDGAVFSVQYATSATSGWTKLSASSDGTSWPTVSSYIGSAQGARASQRVHKIYMCNLTDSSRSWDGTTLAILTPDVYNDDISTPAGGKFPKAQFMVNFQGRIFVASTKEGGNLYPNRVRYSHPGEPEDWRTNDYFDVDNGAEGDVITGMAAKGDRLFIFKNHSVTEVTGTTSDNFAQFPYARTVGACQAKAICVTSVGVFFFDAREGLYLIEDPSKAPRYMFEKQKLMLLDGTMNNAQFGTVGAVNMAWNGHKLYLGLPMVNDTVTTHFHVLDMLVGQGKEAWVEYMGLRCDSITTLRTSTVKPIVLMAAQDPYDSNKRRFVTLEAQEGKDTYVTGTDHSIMGQWRTAWFDMGNPTVKKRYKRATYLSRNTDVGSFHVDVFRDWDQSVIVKQHDVTTDIPGTDLSWYAGGTSTFDAGNWGGPTATRESPLKGLTLGSAYAVQLRMTAPMELIPWQIDEISFRFINKRVR